MPGHSPTVKNERKAHRREPGLVVKTVESPEGIYFALALKIHCIPGVQDCGLRGESKHQVDCKHRAQLVHDVPGTS